jgi:formylglycine-generating enzyme required for sulfatase activity
VTQEPIPTLPVAVSEKPEVRSTAAASESQPLLSPWDLPYEAPPPAIAPFDADTARKHQEAWAEYLGTPVEFENSIGMKFALIPPGEFDMGSTEEEIARLMEEARAANQPDWYIDRLSAEAPRHRVRITKPFYLGATEVTQAEYERVMGTNPSRHEGDLSLPVEMILWSDADEFCRRLGELTPDPANPGYRLPSEAEWEYACRAGTRKRLPTPSDGSAPA